MKSLFGNKLGDARTQVSAAAQMLAALQDATAGRAKIVPDNVATAVLSLEGYGESMSVDVNSAMISLKTLVQQATAQVRGMAQLTIAQEEAGQVAGIAATTALKYATRPTQSEAQLRQMFSNQAGDTITSVIGSATESASRMSMEAFDERNNRQVMNYSVAYNVAASRQNEFGEAFFPTVIIPPDNVGFTVSVRLIKVMDEVSRATTGALDKFNRQNLIRAIIDASILANDTTKLIPVYRKSTPANAATDSDSKFAAGIAPVTLIVDKQPLTTAPYAIGAEFSILGICQTNAMLAAGQEDQSDAVDASVRLNYVYIAVTGGGVTEYFKFDVSQLPTSDFNAPTQGNTQLLQLNFTTKTLAFSSGLKTVDGSASTLLAALGTNTVRVEAKVYGSVTQDLGDTTTSAPAPSVFAVNDASGNALSTASGAGATAAALFVGSTVVGYDLLAYRTNSNRRNRGKLIDTQTINYLYTIPLLPPLTKIRPVGATDSNDGATLSDLISVTRVQTANQAVTALLQADAFLSAYAATPDNVSNQPILYGAAANLVTPAYIAQSLNCVTALDSLTSTARAEDLQSLLMNKIRDMATRLYVNSAYGPASEAMYEGAPPKPVVIIGTDPINYRYLTLNGDLRLLGDMFDYKIVKSYDSRMSGQLLFSFGMESSFNSGVVNPLHFGNMGYKPELTLMMPMVRSGSNIMEMTVQPSYRHVVNLPILGKLTITNIESVIGAKVSLDVINRVVI